MFYGRFVERAETQTERAEAIDAMQKKLEKQRDGEIEIVIIRLEEEAEATKAKLKKEADERAHRAIEQVLTSAVVWSRVCVCACKKCRRV